MLDTVRHTTFPGTQQNKTRTNFVSTGIMARTPSASSLARQAAMDASVQTWTRCRIPIEEGLPYCVDPARDVLAKAPGYYHTTTGRNIDDLDEVVILSSELYYTSKPC